MTAYSKKAVAVLIVLVFLALSLLTVTLFGIAPEPLVNNPSITGGNIAGNSTRIMILYPWSPTNPEKILPFDYIVPAVPGNDLSVRACPGQYEAATFVINAQDDIANIGITASELYNARGNRISSDAINIRLVKVWYQAGENDIWYETPGSVPAPELLLKDDSLVKVDYKNRINYLRVTINGNQQYVDISNPRGTFPSNAEIYDSKVLQPFSMKKNENKQVWMTIHTPDNAQPGDYKGTVTIMVPSYTPVTLNFTVTVLPFSLEPAPVEYAIYYRGIISSDNTGKLDSESKTSQQYALELQNMKEHGVLYPTLYQEADSTFFETAFRLRKESGLPTDHIYISNGIHASTDNSSTLINQMIRDLKNEQTIAKKYGFNKIYVYGVDEGSSSTLILERPSMTAIRNNGAEVYVALSDNKDAVNIVGDLLNVPVLAGSLNTTQASLWHNRGQKIFSYANPQVGIENPEIYRDNYGFALWNAGYDGTMNYAYQHAFGNIWNDFDDVHYRDHVFAYPASDGVIDTVEWEGFREGVDDTRYAATLIKKDGNPALVKAMISESLSKGEDAAHIRETVIEQILHSG